MNLKILRHRHNRANLASNLIRKSLLVSSFSPLAAGISIDMPQSGLFWSFHPDAQEEKGEDESETETHN